MQSGIAGCQRNPPTRDLHSDESDSRELLHAQAGDGIATVEYLVSSMR